MDQETGNIPVILAAMPRVATSKLTTVIVMQNDVEPQFEKETLMVLYSGVR